MYTKHSKYVNTANMQTLTMFKWNNFGQQPDIICEQNLWDIFLFRAILKNCDKNHFFEKNLEGASVLDFFPGFKSQGGFPHLCALSPACNGILRFTSGATPADLLLASMAAKLLRSTYSPTSIGGARVRDLSCPCHTAWDQTGALSSKLRRLVWIIKNN